MLSVIFIKVYSRHINICSVKNLETPFNNTNEISDNEDSFDIELPTQLNNVDNKNFSVNTGNNFSKNRDELNGNRQEEDKQIDNELFILLCSDLMSDDCYVGARTDENLFAYWICLSLSQWQYTFNITDMTGGRRPLPSPPVRKTLGSVRSDHSLIKHQQ